LSWIEGLKRIRLGSLEPNIITEEFVKTLADNPKFCPHFHLSLQSGCNETLKRMNRHYTAEEYLEKCRLLRKYFDMPAITTDVIVGFPGETQEDFMACKSFLETVSFSQMHIFQYSKRKGTRAERMPDQIPEEVKKQRSEILLALESELRHYYWKQFIGKRQQILLEETAVMDGKTYWTGHNERYMKTAILKESEEDLSNQIVEAEITGMMGEHMMLGRTDKR
jgi:threonylcarbamoyladenosine tRNA methylthiotransferase MtaB